MKSKIDSYIADRVKEKRKELGISQRGMAAILGCSSGFIAQVESYNYLVKYSVSQLYVIAQEFESPLSDFFPKPNELL